MRSEQSGNPEMAALKCGLGGAATIVLVGALATWMVFVVGDRVRRANAARHLQGGWALEDGSGFWFDFSDGCAGTMAAWGPDTEFTERVRVVWRRSGDVVIAVGPDQDHEDYFSVRFMGNPDTITMRAEGTETETVILRRQRGPGSRYPGSGE